MIRARFYTPCTQCSHCEIGRLALPCTTTACAAERRVGRLGRAGAFRRRRTPMDTSPDAARVGLDRRSVLELAASAAGTLLASAAPTAWAGRPGSDIVLMEAHALSKAIATRKISCVEVMGAYLDHIDRLNPKVNAIVALQDRSALIAQARERDTQVARGEIMGPLHGFPHAVKDLFWVKGIRSTSGSPIFKDFIPDKDSPPVARLRKAGA